VSVDVHTGVVVVVDVCVRVCMCVRRYRQSTSDKWTGAARLHTSLTNSKHADMLRCFACMRLGCSLFSRTHPRFACNSVPRRDGSGEIDRAEFEMAFYCVDPVSGNSLGFQPSLLLHPRDAYEVNAQICPTPLSPSHYWPTLVRSLCPHCVPRSPLRRGSYNLRRLLPFPVVCGAVVVHRSLLLAQPHGSLRSVCAARLVFNPPPTSLPRCLIRTTVGRSTRMSLPCCWST
jgi:hypothetical protein